MRICSTLFAAMCLTAPVIAEAPVAPRYDIAMTVHDGGQLIAKPRLLVNAGNPARIEIGDAKGDTFNMTVEPSFVSTERVSLAIDAEREHTVGETIDRQRVTTTVVIDLGSETVIQTPVTSQNSTPLRIAIQVDRATG